MIVTKMVDCVVDIVLLGIINAENNCRNRANFFILPVQYEHTYTLTYIYYNIIL